jgi:hypothetical protein
MLHIRCRMHIGYIFDTNSCSIRCGCVSKYFILFDLRIWFLIRPILLKLSCVIQGATSISPDTHRYAYVVKDASFLIYFQSLYVLPHGVSNSGPNTHFQMLQRKTTMPHLLLCYIVV